jgi:DNA modification methylase
VIKRLPISKLRTNNGQIPGLPKNPRFIRDERFEKLKKSISDLPSMLDLRELIVIKQNGHFVTIGGNMRLRAAKDIGLKELPCKVLDAATPVETLAEIAIKDNVGFGSDDFDILANEWTDFPLTDWGMELPDYDAVDDGETADAEPQIDKAAELNKKWKVKSGDLWQIGSHRLLCGDSTCPQAVERVLDGAKPNLMVTDPPYGVDYDANWRNEALKPGNRAVGLVENDERDEWSAAYALFPGNVAYCWHAGLHASNVQASLEIAGFELRCQIIWAKKHFVIGRGHYSTRHEPCWYGVRCGGQSAWIGNANEQTLWEWGLDERAEGGHSTQKPLECMARPVRNHEGDVYEPFAGSGTTLVACQNLNRKCYAIEISENYCAVILERMQTAFPDIEIKRINAKGKAAN